MKKKVKKRVSKAPIIKSRIRESVKQELRREDEIKYVRHQVCWTTKLNKVMIFLAILGILISIYMTWLHFRPDTASFCSINEDFDCIKVNRSVYSTFIIPVAMIGVLGYLSFLLFGLAMLKGIKITQKHLHVIAMLFALIGFIFSIYLTYIQASVLKTWCIMCVASFIVITLILICLVAGYSYCTYCNRRLTQLKAEPDKRCKDY